MDESKLTKPDTTSCSPPPTRSSGPTRLPEIYSASEAFGIYIACVPAPDQRWNHRSASSLLPKDVQDVELDSFLLSPNCIMSRVHPDDPQGKIQSSLAVLLGSGDGSKVIHPILVWKEKGVSFHSKKGQDREGRRERAHIRDHT